MIQEFPQPRTQSELHQFLGLVNFYHRFVPGCASILQSPPSKKDTQLTWTSAVGAVLEQQIDSVWCPISFFSRKLHPAERKYSTFDRELLAAIRHFRHFVEGRQFHLLTDHKPLTFALSFQSRNHSPCQVRHLDYIAQFTSDVRHIKGTNNVAAVTLSCVEVDALYTTSSVIDFKAMAEVQLNDTSQEGGAPSLTLSWIPVPTCDASLLCDTSTGTPHPLVPPQFCRQVFDALHSLSHPGVCATQWLVTSRYVWPGINTDVCDWTRTCLQCQRAKGHQHTSTPISQFPPPDARFVHVHIDLVEPLPPCQGCTYLLTCVDRFTRKPEVVPLTDITATSVAHAFLTWLDCSLRCTNIHHH